ncbi:hypothetical protein CBR_g57899 [Chara braunii]|uniref:Uncharacterized protein n=1 Tax=Chara braunii TaxID=69332 RepID=A0A388MEK5_CHABU|nr:hypothetical protein CBR_g57899 [Chara braunii]|eukprot:GBG92943.1 hypothetical protein CBR_g57899 [Chara braunii]
MAGHIGWECPNPPHGGGVNNYSGAVANTQPVQPLLTLSAPPGVGGQVQPTQYQASRSNNYYPRMGERVEKIETIVGRLDARDRQRQEREEQANRKREEEENREIREKECKELEETIGAQMEAKLKSMYEVYFGKRKEEDGEIDKLKKQMEQQQAASTSQGKIVMQGETDREIARRQLEDLRRREGDLLRTCKATPGRISSNAKEVNDRYQFIKEQRKELGKKNKAQPMEICEKMGITYKKIDVTVEEIVERRVIDVFGSFDSARMRMAREKPDQEKVEGDGTSDDFVEVHEVQSDY